MDNKVKRGKRGGRGRVARQDVDRSVSLLLQDIFCEGVQVAHLDGRCHGGKTRKAAFKNHA